MQPRPAVPPGYAMAPNRPSEAPRASVPSDVRRVSLVDDGPVASSEGMRQVVRGSRRQSVQHPGSLQLPPFDASFGGNPFDTTKKP